MSEEVVPLDAADASGTTPSLPPAAGTEGGATRPRQQSLARAHFDPFAGSNQRGVFEDFKEFETEVMTSCGGWDYLLSMDGWIFQEVNFSGNMSKESFLSLPMEGASFWGCIFPEGVTDDDVRKRGSKYVMSNPDSLPFKPLRAFLYTQDELRQYDSKIYHFFKTESSITARLAYALHDFSILDAMLDYAEGKTFVGVMGGHKVRRGDLAYGELVKLGNTLANTGFVCVTGGGPGAMEACNLGAYLSSHTTRRRRESMGLPPLSSEEVLKESMQAEDARVDNGDISLALELIRSPTAGFIGEEMLDTEAANRVIKCFGPVQCYAPSIGIPTWFYGHEPSNLFASYQVDRRIIFSAA